MGASRTDRKSPEEIQRLKADWLNDPCWDIETTEGFEAHRDELLAFRNERERQWEEQRKARLEAKAAELGIPGNTRLAAHIERLESRLIRLEEALDRTEMNPAGPIGGARPR